MSKIEEMEQYGDALVIAIEALKPQAHAEHAEALAKLPPQAILTRDMCRCGATTGSKRSRKCEALQTLYNALFDLRGKIATAREKAARKATL